MGSACCGRGKGGAATGYTASVLAEARGGEGATAIVWMCVRVGREGGLGACSQGRYMGRVAGTRTPLVLALAPREARVIRCLSHSGARA
jgi:hypothetical protein